MPPLTTDPSDLLRQYMTMSGINTPMKGMSMPFATAKSEAGGVSGDPMNLIKAMMGQESVAPGGYVPGTSTNTIVPKDSGGGGRRAPADLRWDAMARIATPRAEEEAAFKAPEGWKDRATPAQDRARAVLTGGGGGAAAPTTTAAPDAATAPTPEPHQFEGQHTQNTNVPKDSAEFFTMIRPHAEKIAAETGLDVHLVMSKIALETGYGKHAPGFNYFGIKETDPKKGQVLATKEADSSGKLVGQDARFRTYENLDASVVDYIKFLKENSRYGPLLKAKGAEEQLKALQASGYATDPNYAAKIRQIMAMAGYKSPDAKPPPPQVVANVPPNTPEPPSEPGTRVGEHQRGWFWNGTSWDKAYARGGHIKDLLSLSRNYR